MISVALAATWVPRGEAGRLERLRPLLHEVYAHLVVALPPNRDLTEAEPLRAWPNLILLVSRQPFWDRYVALQSAAALPVTHLHYADLDMLVHWIEARPDEWRAVVARIETEECLICERTERAFQTRPQAIQKTEQIINDVGSYPLGQRVDLGLGSRGFSVQAARVILASSQPGVFGDLEWPLLVQRAGFPIGYLEADGVDWEMPDQFRDDAADAISRQDAANRYDQRADRWAARVRTAREIIQEGIAAGERLLVGWS